MFVITVLNVGEIEADPLTEIDDEILNDARSVNIADADAEELMELVTEAVDEGDPVGDTEKLPPIIPDGVID